MCCANPREVRYRIGGLYDRKILPLGARASKTLGMLGIDSVASWLNMKAFFRSFPWTLLASVLIAVFAIGLMLTLIGAVEAPVSADFWSDVSRAGLQLATITVLGAVVTATLKFVDENRRRDEQRLQVFREIVTAYNQVKAVRRNLRALGILALGNPLNTNQALELREQLMALNQAQLSLEAVKRELAESRLFQDPETVIQRLGTVERYLGETVLERWEAYGGRVWEGTDSGTLRDVQLADFIGHKSNGYLEFEENVSIPLDEITMALHAELFGKRST